MVPDSESPGRGRRQHPLADSFFAWQHRLPLFDRVVFYALLVVFVVASLFLIRTLSQAPIVSVPSSGGTLVEGMVGTPRFINPILAITRADHDLVALTHSGLLRPGADGTLEHDLAESVTVSEDGLVYNVTLRTDGVAHDGTPVTAEDVAFTISLIQDPELKSPLRGNWTGVTVELLGTHELNFVLTDPYAPFMENLTVGILPKHVWEGLTIEELPFSQRNTEPVGTGPYAVSSVKRSESGLVNEYVLTAFRDGHTAPKMDKITVRFFADETAVLTALEAGEIDSTAALAPETAAAIGSDYNHYEAALPRTFAVFFNQNRAPSLREESARQALAAMVDRDALIDVALAGHGASTASPVPAGFLVLPSAAGATTTNAAATDATSTDTRRSEAEAILFADDWVQTEAGTWEKEIDDVTTTLQVVLRTGNSPVFAATAAYLAEVWQTLGVAVEVEQFEQSDLVQSVIRPRDYQALLYGTDVTRALDFYPFWHSSQREDPGLNVALYTNITTDALLEDIRLTREPEERTELIQSFVEELAAETPAIFLYSPTFTYITNQKVHITPIARLARPSERFSLVSDWYVHHNDVWPFLQNY